VVGKTKRQQQQQQGNISSLNMAAWSMAELCYAPIASKQSSKPLVKLLVNGGHMVLWWLTDLLLLSLAAVSVHEIMTSTAQIHDSSCSSQIAA
jgi:hypothetical protein